MLLNLGPPLIPELQEAQMRDMASRRTPDDTIPGADYALLEGAGHFSHIEDADQLASTVLPWLAKHAA